MTKIPLSTVNSNKHGSTSPNIANSLLTSTNKFNYNESTLNLRKSKFTFNNEDILKSSPNFNKRTIQSKNKNKLNLNKDILNTSFTTTFRSKNTNTVRSKSPAEILSESSMLKNTIRNKDLLRNKNNTNLSSNINNNINNSILNNTNNILNSIQTNLKSFNSNITKNRLPNQQLSGGIYSFNTYISKSSL